MLDQCSYDLSSIWENFEFKGDPYASPPEDGICNPKQATSQGLTHASTLGKIYKDLFTKDEIKLMCNNNTPNGINMEMDSAQKNQLTGMHVYQGVCDVLPESDFFPVEEVIDFGEVKIGAPFFLHTG